MLEKTNRISPNVNFSIDEGAQSGFVKITGVLTGRKTNAIKKMIESSASAVEYFKLNLENVTAVDVSCIEALYSTCQSMTKSNKPMHIDGICPIAFTSAVEDVGYSHHQWLCFGQ
jgi:anti-anti-sigma regulatory factor